MQADHNEIKKVNISFAPGTYKALEDLAEATGGSLADALRDAIALSKWFKETQDTGGNILVEKNGKLRKIINLQ